MVGQVSAWGPGGHMIVASIAYKQLPPAAQQQTLAILEAHPSMPKWKEQLDKDHPTDPGAYFFMRASTWPDELRKSNSPYDHPAWHYIDYPLTPPNFPFVAGREPENNILFGINESEKTLHDPAVNPEQRAAALSWLIHLIGDLHQPLHCAELVTPQYPLPEGDRGGNLIFVSVGGNPINLHAFWDRLPGMIFSPPFAVESAGRIERTYPPAALPDLVKDKDPVAWSLEGRTIAIESAYLNGKLPGAAVDTKTTPIQLPPDYLAKGKEISDQRLALAGYRLAALLPPLLSGAPATAATTTATVTTAATTAATAAVTTAVASGTAAKPAVVPSAAAALAAAPGVFDKRPATPAPTAKPATVAPVVPPTPALPTQVVLPTPQ